jgi:hypothetical protein
MKSVIWQEQKKSSLVETSAVKNKKKLRLATKNENADRFRSALFFNTIYLEVILFQLEK